MNRWQFESRWDKPRRTSTAFNAVRVADHVTGLAVDQIFRYARGHGRAYSRSEDHPLIS